MCSPQMQCVYHFACVIDGKLLHYLRNIAKHLRVQKEKQQQTSRVGGKIQIPKAICNFRLRLYITRLVITLVSSQYMEHLIVVNEKSM
jgi:hypothetical protein